MLSPPGSWPCLHLRLWWKRRRWPCFTVKSMPTLSTTRPFSGSCLIIPRAQMAGGTRRRSSSILKTALQLCSSILPIASTAVVSFAELAMASEALLTSVSHVSSSIVSRFSFYSCLQYHSVASVSDSPQIYKQAELSKYAIPRGNPAFLICRSWAVPTPSYAWQMSSNFSEASKTIDPNDPSHGESILDTRGVRPDVTESILKLDNVRTEHYSTTFK